MSTVKKFEDLDVWQMARQLAQVVYQLTNSEKFSKDYDLKVQVRRSSGSVMDNIAEGFERSGKQEFIQFLTISKGSCGETRSQLFRALDRSYISEEQFNETCELAKDVGRKIFNLMTYLAKSEHKGINIKRPLKILRFE